MLIYKKEIARDLSFPINRNKISKIYKLALNDISRVYGFTHKFRHPTISLKDFPSFLYYDKIYGNRIGLHLELQDEKYLNVMIPTSWIKHCKVTRYVLSNFQMPECLLYHKRKHHKKNCFKSIVETMVKSYFSEGSLTGSSLYALLEQITIKRMVIKLGSIRSIPKPYDTPFMI